MQGIVGRLPEPTQLQEVIKGDSGEDSQVAHPLHRAKESAEEAPEFGECYLSQGVLVGSGRLPMRIAIKKQCDGKIPFPRQLYPRFLAMQFQVRMWRDQLERSI
jgi:hypothetical protein